MQDLGAGYRIEMISANIDCLGARGTSGKVILVSSPSKASFPAQASFVEHRLVLIGLDERLN